MWVFVCDSPAHCVQEKYTGTDFGYDDSDRWLLEQLRAYLPEFAVMDARPEFDGFIVEAPPV